MTSKDDRQEHGLAACACGGRHPRLVMTLLTFIATCLALAVAVSCGTAKSDGQQTDVDPGETGSQAFSSPLAPTGLPKVVDLGSDSCVPCRMMAPELSALADKYSGSVDVVIVDIYERPDLARSLGIRVIPTQIFLAPDGKELSRHEGFLSMEQMVSIFERLGYPLMPRGVTPVPSAEQQHEQVTGTQSTR